MRCAHPELASGRSISVPARTSTGNARRAGMVEQGVMVKGTVSPGLVYCLQGRSFG